MDTTPAVEFTESPAADASASDWLSKMTGSPEPEADSGEELETDSSDVVESEQEAPEDTPEADESGNPESEPSDEATSEESPDDSAAEPALLAGKFKTSLTPDEGVRQLEAAYRSASGEASRLTAHTRQLEHELLQARQALAASSAAYVPSPRPLVEQLPQVEASRVEALAYQSGQTPQEYLDGLWMQHEQDRRLDWKLQQRDLERQVNETSQASERVNQALSDYAEQTLSQFGERTLQEFSAYPELFSVLRGLAPESREKIGKRFVDLLAAEANLERKQAEIAARETSAYRAGREENRQVTAQKRAARPEASRPRTVASNNPAASPRTSTAGKISELLAAAGQDVYG